MFIRLMIFVSAAFVASAAQAGSQSSNTNSNSSSNNGVVRERVIDSYCDYGYCRRYIHRKISRDDRPSRRYSGYDGGNGYRDDRRRYRDDDHD